MKIPYTYSILRYIHDVLSGEFVNIGIVLYSPEAEFFKAKITQRHSRISNLFKDFNSSDYRFYIQELEKKLMIEHKIIKQTIKFEELPNFINQLTLSVLPIDDSSFQFFNGGVGLTRNPEKTLEELYHRYIDKYNEPYKKRSRTDEDVWRAFKKPLAENQLLTYLKPHVIESEIYKQKFEFSWKNEIWHVNQPISLDLVKPQEIVEKAVNWSGKILNLTGTDERFKISFLLGAPKSKNSLDEFYRAKQILDKVPCDHEIIDEHQAEEFAEKLKNEIEEHEKHEKNS